MISQQDFVLEERKIGRKLHYHNGVWWLQVASLYCKPLFEFDHFAPRTAKPNIWRSLWGYSHQVPDKSMANRTVKWMLLDGEDLQNYSIDMLPSSKRRTIRNGLKKCHFQLINPSVRILEEMRRINISQAQRFKEGGDVGGYLPSSYYEKHAPEWSHNINSILNHKGHNFWGAFLDGTLVAYADIIKMKDTWMVGAVKSHSNYLSARPVDGLYYTILHAASKDPSCKRVVNGGPDGVRNSLNKFKELFLFKAVEIAYFSKSIINVERAKAILNLKQGLKRLVQAI